MKFKILLSTVLFSTLAIAKTLDGEVWKSSDHTKTWTPPSATDTLVGRSSTDTLTNKTLSGNTATNLISGSGTLTVNTSGNITVPNGTDTLVGKATTDTLTNKTLTAPSMTAPTITSGSITTPITANKALTTGASGVLTASATTDTELGYVSGLASSAQTQLDAKVSKSTYSAKGSILAATAASTPADLPIGTNDYVLTADSAQASGLKWSPAGTASPLTTKGDVYGFTTVNARKAVGDNFQVLAADSSDSTGLAWKNADRKNLLLNPSFEAGANADTSWTSTTFTDASETTNYIDGAKSLKLTLSATSGTLVQDVVAANQITGNMEHSMMVKTSLTNVQVCARNNGATVGTCAAVPGTNTWQELAVNYPAPSSGSLGISLMTTSSTTGTIYVDDAYVGKARNTTQVAQAQMYGSVKWPGTASCSWSSTSNATFGDYSADADCTLPSGSGIVGNASSPATKIPGITFASLPIGYYRFVATGEFIPTTASQGCSWRFTDGTNNTTVATTAQDVDAGTGWPMIEGFLNVTSTISAPTFRIQGTGSYGNTTCVVEASTAGLRDLNIQVYRYPSSSEIAVRANSTPASWSGYHDSTCLWTSTSTSYATPSADASCGFTEVTNTNFGTVSSAGSKTPGIVFTPPAVASYYICANTSLYNSNIYNFTTLRMYDGTSQITDVETRTQTADGLQLPVSMCGIWRATSLTSTTISLQIKVSANTGGYGAYGTTSNAINWSIMQIAPSGNVPLLVGSVTSNTSGMERVERVKVATCTSTPCTVSSQSGSWVSSVTRSATGTYAVNIASGIFSSTPVCTCITGNASANSWCQGGGTSSTLANFAVLTNNVTNADEGMSIICMGPR